MSGLLGRAELGDEKVTTAVEPRMSAIERVWEWHFAGSPEELWPVLADTARFNEAVGLPRYAVSETSQIDGSVRRTGAARVFGLTLEWEEGVPEWVAPRRFRHQRRFRRGLLRLLSTEITIDPCGDGAGSQVRYRLRLEVNNWAVAMALRLVFFRRFGRTLDRLFRQAAEFAIAVPAALGEARASGFGLPPPTLSLEARQRITARASTLAQQGYDAAAPLARHLLEAHDSDVERMRPRALARQWDVPPRQAIETFLAAAREGLLILRWDLICPRCRGAKAFVTRLDQLPQGAHCPSCNIPFDRDFSRNVEVTFDPADDIRTLGSGTFCLASPLAAEHIKIQQRVDPGGGAVIKAGLAAGDYRARMVEAGGACDFQVADGALPEFVLEGDNPILRPGSDPGSLQVRNTGTVGRTLVVEDRRWAADALTAHEVTTLQAFRDLFADSVLRPGDQVEIRRVTLMFTDIKGSTALYNRVGDAQAYGWVREHFAVLASAVRRHDGALVKTIGDAVMAAFSNPLDGLAAALAIRDDIAAFNRTLRVPGNTDEVAIIVKLGLHCGPCIAVTLNDRLDYFGRTVNLAARLEHESQGGDIVISEAMAAETGMEALLAAWMPTTEAAVVKGFLEPIALRRIPPPAGCT
jgi:class 3 adenylate cyclase